MGSRGRFIIRLNSFYIELQDETLRFNIKLHIRLTFQKELNNSCLIDEVKFFHQIETHHTMDKLPPSIFNDVIGPVMRGPSSSHTAASIRIARMATCLLGQPVKKAVFQFDPNGSLATTYDGQGSDIGLASGFLGFDMKDERIKDALQIARERGVKLEFIIKPFRNNHPNTYKMTLTGEDNSQLEVSAISTGGGMIEFIELDGFTISSMGDYYEAFIVLKKQAAPYTDSLIDHLKQNDYIDHVILQKKDDRLLLNIKSSSGSCKELVNSSNIFNHAVQVYYSEPVMPVLSGKNISVPFLDSQQALEFVKNTYREPWEIAALYESHRSGFSTGRVLEMMEEIVVLMNDSIQSGLMGTQYQDRILGHQSHLIEQAETEGKLLPMGLVNRVIASVMAMMEVKSSMGLIVAAPTAGACATVPCVLITVGKELNLGNKDIAKGMLVAGLIGVFIADKSTFSAEVAGCQAETGSATGMAAAGLVQLAGGDLKTSFDASSMALQNIFGLACDPVANRVEVPCLGKNIMAAVNAMTTANMALAGIEAVIPLDEVIIALDKTGRSLPFEIRCTGYGGLCMTPSASLLEEKMKRS